MPAFSETLSVASQWLETYWNEVYPVVDEDAILRRNALNCFADPMAVVDGLRRVPLIRSRQHGTFTLRDIDIATHQLTPGEGDAAVDENQVNAAFGALPVADLAQLHQSVLGAVESGVDFEKRIAAIYQQCRTPEQMRMANAFCRYLELARTIESAGEHRPERA